MSRRKIKCLVSLSCLILLAACECGSKRKCPKKGPPPPPVEVTETWTDKGTASDFITIAGDRIFFGFDQSGLKQESKNILLQQCDWLKAHNHHKLLIEGHCDERGSREYNLGLGERRAESVARFLVEQGISGDRIRTISYGKDRPVVAQGSEEEIHRLNRVAISVVE